MPRIAAVQARTIGMLPRCPSDREQLTEVGIDPSWFEDLTPSCSAIRR